MWSLLCHAVVPQTIHLTELRRSSPLRTIEHEVQLLAQHLLKGSILETGSTQCVGKKASPTMLCSFSLALSILAGPCPVCSLPIWKPKGTQWWNLVSIWGHQGAEPALHHPAADFSGCWVCIFEGQIYLQLNKRDKS